MRSLPWPARGRAGAPGATAAGLRPGRPAPGAGPSPFGLLLWSTAILTVGLLLAPLAYLVVRALGAGAEAWAILLDPRSLATLARTTALVAAVTVSACALALPLAWLTLRSDLPGRRFWSVATVLPLVVPSYVGAYLLASALGPRGILQGALEPVLGLERLPSIYGFPGAWLALTLFTYPYPLLLIRAALQRMDPALEAASRSLGQGPWPSFRRITLPQLYPALSAAALLVALYVLRDFGAVSVMRFDSFTRVIYLHYRSAFDRQGAALLALALVGLTALLVLAERGLQGRGTYHATGGQAARPQPRVALGRWRWPAFAFCAGVTGLALVLPAAVLAGWLWRGLASGETVPGLAEATWNAFLGSALAALAALLLGLPIVLLALRRPGRASRLLERLAWSNHALPGLVVALALVAFGLRFMPWAYQSLAMLVAAYVILFLPQALGALRGSLMQIHPSLEEAARTLGRRPPSVLATITLPLAAPGMATAAALVCLTAMKELPATLILAPAGFSTLATALWSAVSEAYFARAAAPALLLILLAAIPTALLIGRGEGPEAGA